MKELLQGLLSILYSILRAFIASFQISKTILAYMLHYTIVPLKFCAGLLWSALWPFRAMTSIMFRPVVWAFSLLVWFVEELEVRDTLCLFITFPFTTLPEYPLTYGYSLSLYS